MLRKSQPYFQHYVKEIEAQAKKQFSYKKNVQCKKIEPSQKNHQSFEGKKPKKIHLIKDSTDDKEQILAKKKMLQQLS